VIEDFRRMQIAQAGRIQNIRKFSLDMGYVAELEFFCRQGLDNADYRGLFNSYVSSTRTTLKAAEALRNGQALII
jgi:hypothetical protein